MTNETDQPEIDTVNQPEITTEIPKTAMWATVQLKPEQLYPQNKGTSIYCKLQTDITYTQEVLDKCTFICNTCKRAPREEISCNCTTTLGTKAALEEWQQSNTQQHAIGLLTKFPIGALEYNEKKYKRVRLCSHNKRLKINTTGPMQYF